MIKNLIVNKNNIRKLSRFSNIRNKDNDDDVSYNNPELKKLGNYYLHFKKELINNFDLDDLKSFDYNSKRLKIKYTCFNSKKGSYGPTSNCIKIGAFSSFNNVIYHELFHMASTSRDSNNIYSGLCCIKKEFPCFYKIKGKGITEGYTEVLSNRYFSKYGKNIIAYQLLVLYASLTERIIGKDNMQKMYMNSDYNGFINCLESYSSSMRTKRFIEDTDYILFNINNRDICSEVTNTNKFLLECYVNKCVKFYNRGAVNKISEIDESIDDYVNNLPFESSSDEETKKMNHVIINYLKVSSKDKVKTLIRKN